MASVNNLLITFASAQQATEKAVVFANTLRPPNRALSREQIRAIFAASQEPFQNIFQQFSAFEKHFWNTMTTLNVTPGANWSPEYTELLNNCIKCLNEELAKTLDTPYNNLLKKYFFETVLALSDFEQYQKFTVVLDGKTLSGQEICDSIFHSLVYALHEFNQLLAKDNWQLELSLVSDAFAKLDQDAQQLLRINFESDAKTAAQEVGNKARAFACACPKFDAEKFLEVFLTPFQNQLNRDRTDYFTAACVDQFYCFVTLCEFSLNAFCRRYEARVTKLKKSIQSNGRLQEQDPRLQKALKGIMNAEQDILERLQRALNALKSLDSSSDVIVSLEHYLGDNGEVFKDYCKGVVAALSRLQTCSGAFFAAYAEVEQKAKEPSSLPPTEQFASVVRLVCDCDKEFKTDLDVYCGEVVRYLQLQSAVLIDSSLCFFQSLPECLQSLGIDANHEDDHYKGFLYSDFFKSKWLALLQNVEDSLDKNNAEQLALLREMFFTTFWCFAQTGDAIREDDLIHYSENAFQGSIVLDASKALMETIEKLRRLCNNPAIEEFYKFVNTFRDNVATRAMFLLLLVDEAGKKNKIDVDLEFVRTVIRQYKTALFYFPLPDKVFIQNLSQALEHCQALDTKDDILAVFNELSQLRADLQSLATTLDCDHNVKNVMFFLAAHPAMQKYQSLIDDLDAVWEEVEECLVKSDRETFEKLEEYYCQFSHFLDGCLDTVDMIFNWVGEQDKKEWFPYFTPTQSPFVAVHEDTKEEGVEVKQDAALTLPVARQDVGVEHADNVLHLMHCLNRVKIVLQKTTHTSPHKEQERLHCMQSAVGNMECYVVALSEILDGNSVSKLCSTALALHLKNAMFLEQLFKFLIAYFDLRGEDSRHVLNVYKSEHDLQKLFAVLRSILKDNNIPVPVEIIQIIAFLKDMSKKTSRTPLQSISQTRSGASKSVTSFLKFNYLQRLSDCYYAFQNKIPLSPLQISWLQEVFPNTTPVDFPRLVSLAIEEEVKNLHRQTKAVLDFAISVLEKMPQQEGALSESALTLRKEHIDFASDIEEKTAIPLDVFQHILTLIQNIVLQHLARKDKVCAIDDENEKEFRQRRQFVDNALTTIPFCVSALRELYANSTTSSADADAKLFLEGNLLEHAALLSLASLPITSDMNDRQHIIFQDYSATRTVSVSHDLAVFMQILEKYLISTRTQSFHLELPKRVSLLKHAYTISCRYPFDDKDNIGVPLNRLRLLGFLHHRYLQNRLLPSEHQLLLESCGPNEEKWDAYLTTKQEYLQGSIERGAGQTFALVIQLLETTLRRAL